MTSDVLRETVNCRGSLLECVNYAIRVGRAALSSDRVFSESVALLQECDSASSIISAISRFLPSGLGEPLFTLISESPVLLSWSPGMFHSLSLNALQQVRACVRLGEPVLLWESQTEFTDEAIEFHESGMPMVQLSGIITEECISACCFPLPRDPVNTSGAIILRVTDADVVSRDAYLAFWEILKAAGDHICDLLQSRGTIELQFMGIIPELERIAGKRKCPLEDVCEDFQLAGFARVATGSLFVGASSFEELAAAFDGEFENIVVAIEDLQTVPDLLWRALHSACKKGTIVILLHHDRRRLRMRQLQEFESLPGLCYAKVPSLYFQQNPGVIVCNYDSGPIYRQGLAWTPGKKVGWSPLGTSELAEFCKQNRAMIESCDTLFLYEQREQSI